MKLTSARLKKLIVEVLDEEKSALQKFKDGEITYDEWQATLFPSKDDVMSPEEQAAQAAKYPPPDPDAREPMPTPAFSRQVPGPDGEVTIQGVGVIDDEDLREASEDSDLQKAKEKLFDKLVAKGYADPKMGHTADGVLADEVEKDSEDYKTFGEAGLLVKHKGKFYVGEF